jgi:2,5-diamino-6-(ribosylamino)-4(3H)-pyrimidinone 5'-phosphate reductase
MQRVFPGPPTVFAPTAIYDDLRAALPEPPAGRPYVLLNMVTSVDGKAAIDGSAAGIGSPTDQTLMRSIRAAADGVLTGAGTLRADKTDSSVGAEWAAKRVAQGLPPKPLAIVLSTDGDFPFDRSDFAKPQPHRVSLVGSKTPPERREKLAAWGRLFVAPTPEPEALWALRILREECGVNYLLVEGGPNINGILLAFGGVDEICWTLAPKLIGSGETLTLIAGPALDTPRQLTLHTAYLHENEFFFRYRVQG